MITLRKMRAQDVPYVAALERECFSLPWPEEAIALELTNPLSLWLVAEENGCFAGYVGSQAVLDEADMMNLAVQPAFRRRGVGEMLVNGLVHELAARRVRCLTLEVRASNAGAIALYERQGFCQVGRRPRYYQKPKEDALIFRKEWDV
ncbi:MAG: ribosomal protein S18-alanine N-acetyltransferase [Faecousia sp.]